MGCTVGTNDCASTQNGIWGRPGAVYDDGTDRVFITTGNGPYNASTGGLNWGDSVLALNPDGTGSGGGMPVDSYTPTTFPKLQSTDADLGSESIADRAAAAGNRCAIQHIAVQAGKDGCVRLINLADLSGKAHRRRRAVNSMRRIWSRARTHARRVSDGPEIKPQPAVWVNPADSSSWIYVTSYSNGSAAYGSRWTAAGKPSLAKQWPASDTCSSGTSPVVANGTLYYMSGNHLVALDAVTGASLFERLDVGVDFVLKPALAEPDHRQRPPLPVRRCIAIAAVGVPARRRVQERIRLSAANPQRSATGSAPASSESP